MAPFIRDNGHSTRDDKGPALTTVVVLFPAIAFFLTILRLWVRHARRALGWDDYTIAAAMVLTMIQAGWTIYAVTRGKGKRSEYLSKAQIEYINMNSYYCKCVCTKCVRDIH
jgi:hypothetical protein